MNNYEYTISRREAVFAIFEKERREWLAAGMSEAGIFIIHFGEDGKGGDYAVWLSERKHRRKDHKYAPGMPLSLETLSYEGEWLKDDTAANTLLEIEKKHDIETVLLVLTPKQRALVRALIFTGSSCAEYAGDAHISKSAVSQMLSLVRDKIKTSYFDLN